MSHIVKLLLCIVLSLLLMIVDTKSQKLQNIRSIMNSFLIPVKTVAQFPVKSIKMGCDYFTKKHTLIKQNKLLNEKISEMTLIINQSNFLFLENQQLKVLLGIAQQSKFKILAAEILFSQNNLLTRKIIINRGSIDGVTLGQGIADHLGILGQITHVFENYAEVSLLDNQDMIIPIQIARNSLHGMLYGRGLGQPLELKYMTAMSDIQIGDILTTSGIDGTYPPGLPVAIINKIDPNLNEHFLHVYCSPVAKINHFRHIIILFYNSSENYQIDTIKKNGKN